MSELDSLTAQQRATLNQFRSAVCDILEPEHDDEYLLRWLIARDFNVSKAEKMIRKSHKLIYNLEAGDIVNNYEPPKLLEKYLFTRFWGFDEEGSPVRYSHLGKADWIGLYKSTTRVEFLKNMLYLNKLDQRNAKVHAEQTGKRNQKSVFVFDYDESSLRVFLDKLVVKHAAIYIPAYPDNFPELLKVAYIINAPPFFHILYNIVKPFLDEKTLRKFQIVSDECKTEVLRSIGPKIVPEYFGGEQKDPDLDPDNITKVGKVPMEFYLDDVSYLKSDDPNTTRIFVSERSCFHHKVNVDKPGTLLKWVFEAKNFNIKFGVFFETPKDFPGESSLKELVRAQLVDCYTVPERGELLCKQAGVYVLQFDNTHSWMRKKEILLQIHFEEPKS